MQTKLSPHGHIALPDSICRQLGLNIGDALDATIEGGRIVLSPVMAVRPKLKAAIDPRTGLPMLFSDGPAYTITSSQVANILGDFP